MNKLKTLKVSEIVPYENNPRKNDKAVKAVAESIRQCTYLAPIVVDEKKVILAGDTRYKAIKSIGYEEVQVLVVTGLTEEQKKKYRILDNKTGEKATWDLMKLEKELDGLDLEGFDFFGMAADLSAGGDDPEESGSAATNTELDGDDFDDEKFKYKCPSCGFKFN